MPPLEYGPLHKCKFPSLSQGMWPLKVAQQWTCPTCNVGYLSTIYTASGGPPFVQWMSVTDLRQRVTALEALGIAQRFTTDEAAATALTARVAALEARKVQTQPRQATATTVALLLNATTDVTATWDTPFPDTDYLYDVLPGAALIGKATVTQKSKTTTAVVLTVKANVAVSASTLTLIGARSTWQ